MSKLWRIAIALILVLALPVQGFAAHAKLFCGPAHQSQAPHCEGHADLHADSPASSSQAADEAPSADKCSACASCCSGAAISAAIIPFALTHQPSQALAWPCVSYELMLVGGLDRPPRLPPIES